MADNNNKENLSSTERIKMASDNLRGTLADGIANEITGNISDDDTALVRFHGMYIQDDRDRREERAAKKLERLYSFMIRLRLTGGFISPEQWIALHHVAGEHSTGVIKITTRQTIQLHGVLKSKVKPTLKAFNEANLTTIATCGDINRNVIMTANPHDSPLHTEVYGIANEITEMLLPKTHGYYEIWLDAEKLVEKELEEDPLYQNRYMPRKFKIAIAIPPVNDVDVLTNDLALIAIEEKGKLKGFNIAVGGGMSATHGNPDHYPRLASVIGFVDTKEKLLKAVYEVLTVQRDYGNRSDRKQARLKYTVDKYGADWYRHEVERRAGFAMEEPRPFAFGTRSDTYGWTTDSRGLSHYTVFVENGRVYDSENLPLKTALLEVAKTGKANIRFTCNQNVLVSDIKKGDRKEIEAILVRFGIVAHTEAASLVRKNAVACVALPTCPLALAEAQRYMPSLLTKIENILEKHDLLREEIVMRMTGCPNGCARPFAAEIGFVGTGPGKYNLYVGGDRVGTRLNTLYKESLDEPAILSELDALFGEYKNGRGAGETFGDYSRRAVLAG
ncbi:MAG TPA: NADPH-dependent assimilatory sulfite reductase hemoprotein subunit [Chitinophagaceae bacterium]|nr:NADPH-dependent assimilatory sulfite reductase hemoprotein subunit [Chitinophagaceae bacterium]